MKKSMSVILAFFFFFSFVAFSAPCFIAVGETTVTIFHTNDVHGRVQSSYRSDGSLSKIGCDILKNVKSQTPNSLLIDAGDPSQGLTFATYSKGEYIFKMMNAAGYDGMTLGNHEFDYGIANLEKNIGIANFPVVAANVIRKDTAEPFLKGFNDSNGCNFIRDVNGKKIGFFGITTEESSYKTNPNNVKNIEFKSAIETSKQQVAELENQGADVIVGIMHIGVDESSSPTSKNIAEEVDGIDIIIDGHSHTQMTQNVNGTFIGQTGTASDYLGKIDINFKTDGSFDITGKLMSAAEVGTMFKPDEEVTNLYNSLYEDLKASLHKVVGKVQNALYGGSYSGKSIARMGETNLGSLMADAMRWEAKNILENSDQEAKNIDTVAMLNGGAVRASIEPGYIRQEDITQTLPSGSFLSLKRVTPHQLYQALENAVSKLILPENHGETLRGEDGRFPQVSGMRVEFDATKTAYDQNNPENGEGERVTKVVLLNDDGTDKKVLDRGDNESQLALVSTDFATSGGDGFVMLKGLPSIAEGDVLDTVLSEYLRKLTVENNGNFFYPLNQNRVVLTNFSELYGNFDAKIVVKQASAVLPPLKAISVQMDSQPPEIMLTNDNGEIILNNLPSGAHSVSLTCDALQGHCYLDNSRDLSQVEVALEPNLEDVDCTINLISQIPEDLNNLDEDTIKFARYNYNSLSSEQQQQITNYDLLLRAEKALYGKQNTINYLQANPVIIFALIGITLCISWVLIKRKSIKNSERKA